jgi:DNA-binding SARP family transcriptional activator
MQDDQSRAATGAGVRVELLGGFRLRLGESPGAVTLPAPCRACLAYLALRPCTPVAREHLAELLWPDSSRPQALTNLRKALFGLRTAAPVLEEVLTLSHRELTFSCQDPEAVDVGTLRSLAASATLASLRQAARYCQEPLLPDLDEEWVLEERRRITDLQRNVVSSLVELLTSRGELPEALARAEDLSRLDLDEDTPFLRAIELAEQMASMDKLERQWRRYVDARRSLELDLSAKVVAAYQRARRLLVVADSQRASQVGEKIKAAGTFGPPAPGVGESQGVGELFVHEADLERCCRLVGDPKVRVVGVVGVAAVGKTTFLRALAHRLSKERPVVLGLGPWRERTKEELWRALEVEGHDALIAWSNAHGATLLVDDADELWPLGSYLESELLAKLNGKARLVLSARSAGSLPLDRATLRKESTCLVELETLGDSAALSYLEQRGVNGEVALEVITRLGRSVGALALGADAVIAERQFGKQARSSLEQVRAELLDRWLHAVPDDQVELLSLLSVVWEADQAMLSRLSGERVTRAAFVALTEVPGVRVTKRGVALHDDLRQLLADDLEWRDGTRARALRASALSEYRRRMEEAPPLERERLVADHLFLAKQALLRDVLFCPDEPALLYTTSPRRAEVFELEAVLEAWGAQRMELPRPAGMVEATRALLRYRGTLLRLVRRRDDQRLVGFAAAVPICRESLSLLGAHPAIGPYIEARWAQRADLPSSPDTARAYHFSHAAYVGDAASPTRARLVKEMFALLARNGVYSVSTPDPEYQRLVESLGFARLPELRHLIYGRHYPCEHYELDLSKLTFARWAEALIEGNKEGTPLNKVQMASS